MKILHPPTGNYDLHLARYNKVFNEVTNKFTGPLIKSLKQVRQGNTSPRLMVKFFSNLRKKIDFDKSRLRKIKTITLYGQEFRPVKQKDKWGTTLRRNIRHYIPGRCSKWAVGENDSAPQSLTNILGKDDLEDRYQRLFSPQEASTDHIDYGEKIGEGGFGEVYLDRHDSRYVLKDLTKLRKFMGQEFQYDTKAIIIKEVESFKAYYGDDAAFLIKNEGGESIIRMKKIDGIPMNKVSEFPQLALDAFYDMLNKLAEYKIMHDDLNGGNILYDSRENKFNPIDFSNSYSSFFKKTAGKKTEHNTESNSYYKMAVASIIGRTNNSPYLNILADPEFFYLPR